MIDTRFLQIHTLHGHAAVLLNRDEASLGKRITYGDAVRSRISSQCLKRHWRENNSIDSLDRIPGTTLSTRSRETINVLVTGPLTTEGYNPETVAAIEEIFNATIYSKEGGTDRGSRQSLLLGQQEINYLASEAGKIAKESGDDAKKAKELSKLWAKESKSNLRAMREQCKMPGGMTAALTGRMMTSDPMANIDGAMDVSHALTVHTEETEYDYFTVVDDLHNRGTAQGAADHIDESELGCGLYYGYVMIDRNTLLANVSGDQALAGEIVRRMVRLIATVSPGARRGATAPYSYACWLMVEAGEQQPRSLAEAFRTPCKPTREAAQEQMTRYLNQVDKRYGNTNTRRALSIEPSATPGATDAETLEDVAIFAQNAIRSNGA